MSLWYGIIAMIILWLWLFYEMWSATHLEERPDGTWKTIKPAKKFRDLWRKRF
jgi:hypothetical protein